MKRNIFIKGMGLGIVVGSVAGMVLAPRKKHFCLGKALKTMGGVVESITDTIGL